MSLYVHDDGSIKIDAATDRIDEFVEFVNRLKAEDLDTREHRQLAVLLDETFNGRPIDDYAHTIVGAEERLQDIGDEAIELSNTLRREDPVFRAAYYEDLSQIIGALMDA